MFVRTRIKQLKSGPASYSFLLNNTWNPVKRKNEQQVIANLGRTEELANNGTIEKIITALNEFSVKHGFSPLANGMVIDDIGSEDNFKSTLDYGVHLLSSHLIHELSLDKIITACYENCIKLIKSDKNQKNTKIVSLTKYLTAITILITHRLLPRSDASELSTLSWYHNNLLLVNKITLTKDDLYRSLDLLLLCKDKIELEYFHHNRNLFTNVSLVLFDTTSIYYWGEGESDNDNPETNLLQYGFSKDNKSNLKQLIVGVLMTSEGTPIAHEVFRGNQNDTQSFKEIIEVVKKKYAPGYCIDKLILIADRGMVSELNLINLEESGISYIVGVKMRKLPKKLREDYLVKDIDKIKEAVHPSLRDDLVKDMELDKYLKTEVNYEKVTDELFFKEFKISDLTDKELTETFINPFYSSKKTIEFNKNKLMAFLKQRRYFVCLNPYEVISKSKKREYFKKIIENKIKYTPTKDWIIKNGYKKYLKFEKGIEPTIDNDKINNEEIYDGKWIIMTNDKTISSYNAGTYYKTLSMIEKGFRDLKNTITVQPLFHFKEDRIKAHIFICFLALISKWYLYSKLDSKSQVKGKRFLEQIINMKAICISDNPSLYVRTEITPETQNNMKTINMKIPNKIIIDRRIKPKPVQKKAGRPKLVDQKKEDTNNLIFFTYMK